MPAANGAIETQGTKFYIMSTASPPVAVQIKGLVSFNGPDGQASEIDCTDLDSTAKEFLMGLPDEGSFSLSLNLIVDDPGQLACQAARNSRALRDFKWELSSGEEATFSGYVMTCTGEGGVDAKVSRTIAIRVSGPVGAFA